MLPILLVTTCVAVVIAAAPALDVSANDNCMATNTDWGHQAHAMRLHPIHYPTSSPCPSQLVVKALSANTHNLIDWTATVTSSLTSTDLEYGPTHTQGPLIIANTKDLATEFPPSGDYVFYLTIRDGYPQNVGTLRGADLYHEIYQALLGLCPDEKWNCWTWDGVTRKPPIFNWYKTLTFDLITQGVTHKGQGKLQIWVTKSGHRSNQIKRLMVGTISSSIQAAVESLQNQPEVFSHNIPHYIALKSRAGDNIEVKFKALHPTTGNFDCLSGAQKSVIVLEDLMTEWRSIVGNGQAGIWCQPR